MGMTRKFGGLKVGERAGLVVPVSRRIRAIINNAAARSIPLVNSGGGEGRFRTVCAVRSQNG